MGNPNAYAVVGRDRAMLRLLRLARTIILRLSVYVTFLLLPVPHVVLFFFVSAAGEKTKH